MTGERFDYVWDAIASDPAEAADLRHRADLMIRLNALIKERRWTQTEAAARLGVTPSRVSDLMRGRISRFSVGGLLTLTTAAGLTLLDLRRGEAAEDCKGGHAG